MEWREKIREEQSSKSDWVGVGRVKITREEQSASIKENLEDCIVLGRIRAIR